MAKNILKVRRLVRHFAARQSLLPGRQGRGGGVTRAVDDVSIDVAEGEVLVIAGGSGSGKSTLARLIMGAEVPDSGSVFFEGRQTAGEGAVRIRLGCQMVHQNPYDSINPAMRIGDIVSEPLEIHGLGGDAAGRRRRVVEVLRETKMEPVEEVIGKYPHMLSGGQRQRVVLARALAPRPRMIIADEPVSMLDVSIRSEILELIRDMCGRHGISVMYITHDLATARHLGDRIAVMYGGRIVETGRTGDVLARPRHPYTRALVDAVSTPDPANRLRKKTVRINDGDHGGGGQNSESPRGCRFVDRCPCAVDRCAAEEPELVDIGGQRSTACFVDIGQTAGGRRRQPSPPPPPQAHGQNRGTGKGPRGVPAGVVADAVQTEKDGSSVTTQS